MRHTKTSVTRYVALAIVLAVVPALALAQDRPSDSIKVHGHWVIEVHNRDGSLASRTEFENALVPSSASPFLAKLLARNGVFFYPGPLRDHPHAPTAVVFHLD